MRKCSRCFSNVCSWWQVDNHQVSEQVISVRFTVYSAFEEMDQLLPFITAIIKGYMDRSVMLLAFQISYPNFDAYNMWVELGRCEVSSSYYLPSFHLQTYWKGNDKTYGRTIRSQWPPCQLSVLLIVNVIQQKLLSWYFTVTFLRLLIKVLCLY